MGCDSGRHTGERLHIAPINNRLPGRGQGSQPDNASPRSYSCQNDHATDEKTIRLHSERHDREDNEHHKCGDRNDEFRHPCPGTSVLVVSHGETLHPGSHLPPDRSSVGTAREIDSRTTAHGTSYGWVMDPLSSAALFVAITSAILYALYWVIRRAVAAGI